MPKQLPEQILFSPGDFVRQKLPVLRGNVRKVELIDNRPHYTVDYIDPLTGDADTRTFTNDEIEDDPEAPVAEETPATSGE